MRELLVYTSAIILPNLEEHARVYSGATAGE